MDLELTKRFESENMLKYVKEIIYQLINSLFLAFRDKNFYENFLPNFNSICEWKNISAFYSFTKLYYIDIYIYIYEYIFASTNHILKYTY